MPEVTCPRCETRQTIDAGVDGYACGSCGARWVFATCESCGERFHMPPGTSSWTCPNCGYQHGAPAPVASAPRHMAPASSGDATSGDARRSRRLRLGIVAVVGIAAVVVGSFLLTNGGDGTAGQSPTPDAMSTLCLHLRDLQTLRVDALTRVAQEIAVDADAIAATGDDELAGNVRALRRAIVAERDALATQTDDPQTLQDMVTARSAIPC